jgi:Uma2 family endonuclease
MQTRSVIEEIPFLTVDEYLEGEQHSEIRHEYFDGRVFAVAGATDTHQLIAGKFFTALQLHLEGTPCKVFLPGMKVRLTVLEKDLFYYPDVMVACDPTDNHRLFRERPKLIIEVLSEDENKDLVEKYFAYQRISTLEEYVVASQDLSKPEVRIFRRAEGWEPGETHRDGEFTLRSVSLKLRVKDVYAI